MKWIVYRRDGSHAKLTLDPVVLLVPVTATMSEISERDYLSFDCYT